MKYLPTLLVFLAVASLHAQSSPSEVAKLRTTIEKWVEVRQNISEERSEWKAQKATLEATKEMLSSELEGLNDTIEKLEGASSEAGKRVAELEAQKEEQRETADALAAFLADIEDDIAALTERFPEPLTNQLEQLIVRLPKSEEAANKLSLGERMQNVVGILNQAEKFDSNVAFTGETRQVDGSSEALQVNTLYWGLGIAFYVDSQGQYGGVALPGEEGWTFEERNDIAPTLQTLMNVYQRTADAQFVSVPVNLNQ